MIINNLQLQKENANDDVTTLNSFQTKLHDKRDVFNFSVVRLL